MKVLAATPDDLQRGAIGVLRAAGCGRNTAKWYALGTK
jgi:hypothetical protein